MKRTAQRARNKAENVTATPSSLESLIISQEFREIPAKDGPGTELFLQYDSADVSPNARHRIIIFTTDRNLDILDQAQHWFGDGTFRLTPRFFSQIYTIHALHLTKVLPLVYVLMTSKSEELYKEMFLRLKSLKPTLNPTTMMTDFELAAINAFHHVFPAAQQRGCFFHHQQCLVRKMQDLKILDKYNNDEIFHIKVNMLPALAFVPEDNVTAAFENLIDDARFDDSDLFELIGYYSDVYVLGVGARGRRRLPLYEPKLWNCYTAVIEKIPKTNNDLEGWHNRFGSYILGSHPTIWKFIEAIKRDEQTTFVDNVQSQVGTSAKRSRKTYRNYAEKLHDLVNAYDPDSNIIDYLESIAHNI